MIVIFNFSQAKGGFEDTIAPTVRSSIAPRVFSKPSIFFKSVQNMILADQQLRFQDESKQVLKALVLRLLKPKPILMLLHYLDIYEETNKWGWCFCHLYYQRPHFWVASFHWQRRNPHMYIAQCTFIRLLLKMLSLSTHFKWVTDFVYLCIWRAFEICPSEREGQ